MAASSWSLVTVTYRMVVAIEECPISSLTTGTAPPRAAHSVPASARWAIAASAGGEQAVQRTGTGMMVQRSIGCHQNAITGADEFQIDGT